jgi:hypothetical protein
MGWGRGGAWRGRKQRGAREHAPVEDQVSALDRILHRRLRGCALGLAAVAPVRVVVRLVQKHDHPRRGRAVHGREVRREPHHLRAARRQAGDGRRPIAHFRAVTGEKDDVHQAVVQRVVQARSVAAGGRAEPRHVGKEGERRRVHSRIRRRAGIGAPLVAAGGAERAVRRRVGEGRSGSARRRGAAAQPRHVSASLTGGHTPNTALTCQQWS